MSGGLAVLVIDARERSLIQRADHLLLEGHEVSTAASERAARLKLATQPVDVALLIDVGSAPQTLALLRGLRRGAVRGADPHVRVVTVGADSEALATAHYKAGSDLALPTKVSPALLAAAVESLGDRAHGAEVARVLHVGSLVLDPDLQVARVGERSVKLTRREFDLLQCLARAPQRTFSRAELAEHVWGTAIAQTGRTMDSHLFRIRRKLAEAGAPEQLQCIRGVGFRLSR